MNYQKRTDQNQLMMVNLSAEVPDDSWARIVELFVDNMPIEEFGFKHAKLQREGQPPYHPRDMFKLLVFGQREGLRSSAKLAKACRVNIELWYLMGMLTPSPRTISYFREQNADAIKKAHKHFVKLLKSWNLIDGKTIAVDSTKMRAQNSMKNNFNKKKVDRHLKYIEGRIDGYLDKLDSFDSKKVLRKKDVKDIQNAEKGIEEQERRENKYKEIEEQITQSSDGQVSTTDPDARAVIHSRGAVECGYNVQVTADSKHNLLIDAHNGGVNDTAALHVAGTAVQDLLEIKNFDLLADAGYHNGSQLAACEAAGITPYVSPVRQSSSANEGYRKEDFTYISNGDFYICPQGNELHTNGALHIKKQKQSYRFKRYATKACIQCPVQDECTKRKQGRLLERSEHQEANDRNAERIEHNKDYYRQRQQIIEHPFGTFKRQWGITYFLTKGKEKVMTEFNLAMISYNLMRIVGILGLNEFRRLVKASFYSFLDLFSINFKTFEQVFLKYKLISSFSITSSLCCQWKMR